MVRYIEPKDIENYLVSWDSLDWDSLEKAYPSDEFEIGDCWQLLDFMKKIKLPYPIDDNGNPPKGQIYKLWTTELPLQS